MNQHILKPGFALDIDDTIAYTDHDWFHEMKKLFGDPGFNYEDHHNYVERLNYIWTSEEANKFMREKIHDNEYQKTISLVPGALEKVTELHKQNLFNCYITARPNIVVHGTKYWLNANGFPDLPIIAKPLDVPKDKEHLRKAETLYTMYRQGVLGIIDDQTKLIEQMHYNFSDYKGKLYLLTKRPFKFDTNINYALSNHWDELFHMLILDKDKVNFKK